MLAVLSLLVFLGGLIALIVVGTKLNLYLFSQGVLGSGSYRRIHRTQSAYEKSLPSREATIEERFYMSLGDGYDVSSRYAWGGMVIVATFVVLLILAAISALANVPHP